MPICLYDYIFLLLGEGKCVFIREEMDFGFERALLIPSLHYTINPNINVKLSEQRALMCFETEGETRFSFPRLWSQEKVSKQCVKHSITLSNALVFKNRTDWFQFKIEFHLQKINYYTQHTVISKL